MRITAVRLGLLAGVAALLVAGRPADGTGDAGMTKPEASAFKRELLDKYKAFDRRMRAIAEKAAADFREVHQGLPTSDAMQAIQQEEAVARNDAVDEFLEGMRACLDAANAEGPHRADAGAGSIARNLVAKANAALAKAFAGVEKEAQGVQAASRKACQPIAIHRECPELEFHYAPPGAPGAAAHRPEVDLTFACVRFDGSFAAVATTGCSAPHPDSPGCDVDDLALRVTDLAGTLEVPMERFGDSDVWIADFDGPVLGGDYLVEVVPFLADAGDYVLALGDGAWLSCAPEDARACAESGGCLVSGDALLELDLLYGSRETVERGLDFDMDWYSLELDATYRVHVFVDTADATQESLDVEIFLAGDLPADGSAATCTSSTAGELTGWIHFPDLGALLSEEPAGPVECWIGTDAPAEVLRLRACPDAVPFTAAPCVEGVSVTVDGSPATVDPLRAGSRFDHQTGVDLSLDYDDAPTTPGGQLLLFLRLLDGGPTQGAVTVPVTTASPITFSGAEILMGWPPLTGTLTIHNVEAILPGGTGPIRMTFVSTDGKTVIEWCLPQSAVPYPG
jgi:hypothetical protein